MGSLWEHNGREQDLRELYKFPHIHCNVTTAKSQGTERLRK
jgi:hypothetical protein